METFKIFSIFSILFRILLGETSTNVFKFQNLTQEDYVKKLGDLRKILVFKWKQERRIECIRVGFFSLL